MSQTTEKRSRFSRFGRWVAELVLVFVGVYTAFWLSNYQQHRQDAERRDRILAYIEQTLSEGIESSKDNRAKEQEPEAAEFRRALDAGEMPPVRPFVFITDYSPSDLATMLQSGGVQLFDVQTLKALRSDENIAEIPIFAVTANALPKDLERGVAAGFDHYIVKPLNIPQFIAAVDVALAQPPARRLKRARIKREPAGTLPAPVEIIGVKRPSPFGAAASLFASKLTPTRAVKKGPPPQAVPSSSGPPTAS